MPTTEDLIGSSASHSAEGLEITRVFHVTNIPGNPSAKASFALTASKIPNLGDPHPTEGNLWATNRSVSFIDSDNARVTVNYRIPIFAKGQTPPGGVGQPNVATNPGQINVGASVTTRESILDRLGDPITVAHNVMLPEVQPVGFVGPPQLVPTRVEQVRSISVMHPQTVLRVQRVENGSPDVKARIYVGTVNKKGVGKNKLDGPRKWLCTRIDGISNDGGTTYNVTYEFQHNFAQWLALAEWIDPETGLPVPFKDRNTNEESLLYQVYREEDFNALNIAFT